MLAISPLFFFISPLCYTKIMQLGNENWQPPQPQSGDAPRSLDAPIGEPSETPDSPESTMTPAVVDQSQADAAESVPYSGADQVVRWQASEYIYREKNQVWYITFGIIVVGLIALATFAFQSITFAILIPVMAAALAIYSRHAPTILDYTLGRKGLHIDDKLYPYEQFKEFGLIHGDDQFSVMLVPRERFKPGVTVYFPEEVGEAVVDMLAARLPMHDIKLDPIDRFIRMLKI